MQGKIKWFNTKARYGFIASEGENDIFVHVTGLTEGYEPKEGDSVTYEIAEGKKGPLAVKVKPV